MMINNMKPFSSKKICLKCGSKILDVESFNSTESYQKYKKHGLCQECQNKGEDKNGKTVV